MGTVETTIDDPLNPHSKRVEQGNCGQGRCCDCDGRGEAEHPGHEGDNADVNAYHEAGDDRVGERPADEAVDLIQPVFENGDADAEWERRNADNW